MNIEKIIEVLKVAREEDAKAEAFLRTIPLSVNQVFFETPYIEAREKMFSSALRALTSGHEFLYYDVIWFLYELGPNNKTFWLADKTPVVINTDEDYYNYLRSEYGTSN